MNTSWYALLGNDFVRLLILDLVFTGFVWMGARKRHFSYWVLFVPTIALFLGYQLWQILW
ncbi:hypothetical protein ACVRXQ_06665 [Streptococcus panodentis]|uniref:Uncharacterized protein n=1 Tax=Streptococcus panodentis TaxID=1581472 RepID=A0ABS5AVD6_9STRE|nr:hypothetical protein [Streptococcus panodentis]MBP2620460.1 hypothetical protein [Streptococcus panodentis]